MSVHLWLPFWLFTLRNVCISRVSRSLDQVFASPLLSHYLLAVIITDSGQCPGGEKTWYHNTVSNRVFKLYCIEPELTHSFIASSCCLFSPCQLFAILLRVYFSYSITVLMWTLTSLVRYFEGMLWMVISAHHGEMFFFGFWLNHFLVYLYDFWVFYFLFSFQLFCMFFLNWKLDLWIV